MATGDARAIGDWFRGTRYTKNQVDEFFVLNNSYTPYLLTFTNLVSGKSYSITGRTSLRSYNIKENKQGLFFFDQGEIIDIYCGTAIVKSYTLNDTEDEIQIIPLAVVQNAAYRSHSPNQSVFTAPKDGTYLCININTYNGGNTGTVYSTIESAGTLLYSDTTNQQYSGSTWDRLSCVVFSIYELDEGETVTFKNTDSAKPSGQMHLMFEIDISLVKTLERKAFGVKVDNHVTNPTTITVSDQGQYIALSFVTIANTSHTGQANIITNENICSIIKGLEDSTNGTYAITMLDHVPSENIGFGWVQNDGWTSKGYFLMKIAPAPTT